LYANIVFWSCLSFLIHAMNELGLIALRIVVWFARLNIRRW
jgi:hypothetical protein